MRSHALQACFSRTVRITRNALRSNSSCSAASSPGYDSAPPQSGQQDSAGVRRFSSRGSDSGNGLRVRVCRSGRGAGRSICAIPTQDNDSPASSFLTDWISGSIPGHKFCFAVILICICLICYPAFISSIPAPRMAAIISSATEPQLCLPLSWLQYLIQR